MRERGFMSRSVLMFVVFICFTAVFSFAADEKMYTKETGGIDVYVGLFNPPDYSIDDYAPVEGAVVKVFNEADVSMWYSGTTDQKGYLRLNGIETGKYLIAAANYEGDYFFTGGVLVVKEKEDSKVYLHLELESGEMKELKEKVREKKIKSSLPNLVGKIIEVSKSPSVVTQPVERERKE